MLPSMRPSSQNDLSVYDFNEEEESVEVQSGKIKSRYDPKRPKTDEPINKYFFLQAFTSESNLKQTDITKVSCLDLCERGNTRVSYAVDTEEEDLALIEEKSESDEVIASSSGSYEHGQICQDVFDPGVLTGVGSLVMGASIRVVPSVGVTRFSEPSSDGTLVDVNLDDEESLESDSISPSTSGSDNSEDEGFLGRPLLYYPAFGDTYDNNIAVIVSPDRVLYGKTLYGESQLTFFSDCIKIECSDSSGNDKKFVSERTVADIIHIDCHWIGSAEVAIVNIGLSTTESAGTTEVNNDPDAVILKLFVTGIQWLEMEQKIKSLAPRYKDVWNDQSKDVLPLEDDFMECNMPISKHYFTEIEEPFEDVIYPKGDPDAVSISKRDIELLQPDTFINDTIIDFYIKYMKNKIQPGEKHRFHFFNSFFFRKLADLDKDPGSALEGRAAFQRVRKWTRKLNLFDKDYIFIPVNYNLHWSLLVICHPGEIATVKDFDVKESPKVPCILHMDSIKGSHSGLRTLIQSYLREEWKERHPESHEKTLSKFSDLRFVALELPQQENSFDCGLFLLHYVELFLEKAPANFSPFKVTKFSRFLTADWFLPAEASLKRSLIRKLIYDLLKDPCHPCSQYPEKDINQEPAVDFLAETCATTKSVCNESDHFVSDSRIEIKLLSIDAPDVAHCDKQGLILREFLSPSAVTESSTECRDHPFQQSAGSQELNFIRCTIEEYADTSEQLVSTCLNKDNCQPVDGNCSVQICSTSYLYKDARTHEMSCSSRQEKEELGLDSLNSDCVVSNLKVETEIPESLPENCEYVPDSPITSYGEGKLDSCVEFSQKMVTSSAGGGRCEDSQGVVYTKEADSGDDTDSQGKDATKAEVKGGEDYQNINTRNAEGMEGKDVRDCQETNTDEAEGGDRECPQIGIVSSDDESTLEKDDTTCREGDAGERLGQQPQKRRKLMSPGGGRRRTRSCA